MEYHVPSKPIFSHTAAASHLPLDRITRERSRTHYRDTSIQPLPYIVYPRPCHLSVNVGGVGGGDCGGWGKHGPLGILISPETRLRYISLPFLIVLISMLKVL